MGAFLLAGFGGEAADRPAEYSGIYPHLAYYNQEDECGTGAVVPWKNRLWVITYAPHKPGGSTDKLYMIDCDLNLIPRPESVGGTPANRMIHRESNTLLLGPYLIDDVIMNVSTLSPKKMFGRLTGTARHLTEPANKVYYATMEEGFYEVDVRTREVRELYQDANRADVDGSLLPGCHGKGLYSGQGVLVYANNGEHSKLARTNPDIPSGCLAEWDGKDWTVVRRNQFTEVTGPGGIYGNENPLTDPIWSIGWDHRSLILMLRDHGTWHSFRLPKASHCYDGAHGWNTEWPRIRDIGEDDLLMTMHGTLWRFPRSFSLKDTAGIAPRSTYLKVVGDFCRWEDRVVFGCDDTAKAEFLNKRNAKGNIAPPGQSHSNLWFVSPERLSTLGAALGRGAVWLNDDVKKGGCSEPLLFSGYDKRGVHITHRTDAAVEFVFEIDEYGSGAWQPLCTLTVPASGYLWHAFPQELKGAWVQIRTDQDCERATVFFQYMNEGRRTTQPSALFDGIATATSMNCSGGLVYARGLGKGTLLFAATTVKDGKKEEALYEMDKTMALNRLEDPRLHKWMKKNVSIPEGFLTVEAASVLYVDDAGNRYRLPKGDPALEQCGVLGPVRIDREVCTERDLFNSCGTFYELPAKNAGGFAKIRPIATHNRQIQDYCSWRGLLVMTGMDAGNTDTNRHIIRSQDGTCAVWVGAVDDLWAFGEPVGRGGPWKDTEVNTGEPSDPYLMTGYDKKTLYLSHKGNETITVRVEVDITGTGLWCTYEEITVPPNEEVVQTFPDGFQAYWLRTTANENTTVTAQLVYE